MPSMQTGVDRMTQSTFQKELEGKERCHRAYCAHTGNNRQFCYKEYPEKDVLSAQSKALEAFEKDLEDFRENNYKGNGNLGKFISIDSARLFAQKHFGQGG